MVLIVIHFYVGFTFENKYLTFHEISNSTFLQKPALLYVVFPSIHFTCNENLMIFIFLFYNNMNHIVITIQTSNNNI